MNLTRILTVVGLAIAALGIAALHADQVVVTETIQGPVQIGGRGAAGAPIPLGTGLIFGQAVEADSTRPVPGVLVTLTFTGRAPLRALADGQGRFAFRDLPKGRYNLTISKAGYVDGAYGRMRPGGPTQSLDLDEGERLGGFTVSIWKFAAIAGFVMDENGEPLIGAQVRALRRSIVGGQWRLMPGPTDLTDDRGAYRIGALEPGEYVVMIPMIRPSSFPEGVFPMDGARDVVALAPVAQARVAVATSVSGGAPVIVESLSNTGAAPPPDEEGRPQAYPTQFYPAATSSARAVSVAVASGDERTGIDFQVRPVRTTRVAGTITSSEGPAGNMPVTLVPAEADDSASQLETLTAISDASGNFSFPAVPAGNYTLRSSRVPRSGGPIETIVQGGGGGMIVRSTMAIAGPGAQLPTDPVLWAESTVAVGTTDITDLAVSLRTGLKVTGQVQFDGTAKQPTPDQLPSIALFLEPAVARAGAPALNARGRVESNGQFQTMGVPPGQYFLRVPAAPPGWSFRGAMLSGVDIADAPFEIGSGDVTSVVITFTDRPSDLSGQVATTATSNDKDTGATVIIFPADSSAWVGYGSSARRLRNIRVDRNGRYSAQNLPAGDYLVVAVPDKSASDWQNPKFLGDISASATRVRVGQGEKVTQNLQVVR